MCLARRVLLLAAGGMVVVELEKPARAAHVSDGQPVAFGGEGEAGDTSNLGLVAGPVLEDSEGWHMNEADLILELAGRDGENLSVVIEL